MKHLIHVCAVVLSITACSSDPSDGGGSGGSSGATAGASATGGRPSSAGGGSGVAGSPSTGGGGGGAGTAGGPTGNTAGAAPTAGSPSTGGSPGAGGGGTSAGGGGAGGGGAGGGPVGTGGSGPAATFKCDNLSLAPSTTGVAKPAGAVGGLKVIDWAGFKGAASFTFDDNTVSQIPNYNAMKATGARFTWFVIGSSVSNDYKATLADGQEIANHTQSHPMSASQGEVTNAQSTIKTKFGIDARSMAAPNCQDAWAAFAGPAKLFQNRGPCAHNAATVSPRDTTDPLRLPAWLPDTNETAANMSAAITMGKWRIFVIHGFTDQNTYQPIPIANVTGSMSKAVMDGFWVEGMTNVGAYWQGQKLIPAAATTSATWTLPANFPPNMCVRITTTGGTVTQKNETINWDAHGYYQISLDAGEVTIK